MEQESLQDYLDKQTGVTQPGFIVDTDQKADWALRKIAAVKAQQAQIKADAQSQIELVKQWETEQNERLEKDVEYFTGMLVSYATTKRENDPKFKTQKLPHGKIGFRKQQPQWNFTDDAAELLKEHGYIDLIREKPELEKAKIKKAFTYSANGQVVNPDTGELIKGITVDVRDDKPIVEVN
jgi:phage host-nuclease inhibitor protein Gam